MVSSRQRVAPHLLPAALDAAFGAAFGAALVAAFVLALGDAFARVLVVFSTGAAAALILAGRPRFGGDGFAVESSEALRLVLVAFVSGEVLAGAAFFEAAAAARVVAFLGGIFLHKENVS